MGQQKTNVMRILEQKKIPYTAHEYPHGEDAVDGLTVARMLGQNPGQVFKTLVARGSGKKVYVFAVPVAGKLDYRKAAKAVGEKSVAMVPVSEILELTGYVRGGCSPIGMKKQYPTVYDASILEYDSVMFSAGKIGFQVELAPAELIRLTAGITADLCEEEIYAE